tara:strand:- start:19 stop:237 length:219 start_codon:yes stop_codon:yes gene_type:complete
MKITHRQLRRLIKEELSRSNEQDQMISEASPGAEVSNEELHRLLGQILERLENIETNASTAASYAARQQRRA